MQTDYLTRLRVALAGLIVCALPLVLSRWMLKPLGYEIGRDVRIGFSLILCDRVTLQKGSRIGHFNFIRTPKLALGAAAKIGQMNLMRGPVRIELGKGAAIGNRNVITRAPVNVTYGNATLHLGALSKITAAHSIDCTASVTIGDYSILAGKGSQIWTHGYVHDETGPGRYRVDGPVVLGNNVYVGARALITGGVTVADGVIIGAGVPVARSLEKAGLYVSGPLRMLPRPVSPDERPDMVRVSAPNLVETVYEKRDDSR